MIGHATIWGAIKDRALNGIFDLVGTTNPISGNGLATNAVKVTGLGVSGFGSRYINTVTGAEFWNEGTALNPYWSPIDYRQPALLSWQSDFRDGGSKAVADTAAMYTIPGSGLRVFGNVNDNDAGLTVAIAEDGPVASLVAGATSGKTAALGVGLTTSVPFQPDTHGPLVIDAVVSNLSAITARRLFFGFLGTAADALATPFTGSGTTITMVQDDMAGLCFDSGLTAAARLFAPHNKSDEAASIVTTAAGVDTGVDIAAAATYQRLRVEISRTGVMTCFVNKAQITQIAAALDVDEETSPVVVITSLASATKTLLLKHFAAYGQRASYLS